MPFSRIQDDQRRFIQQAIYTMVSDPYKSTQGLYLDVSYTPEQLKQVAKVLCKLADKMRENQRQAELGPKRAADWEETKEILGEK